MLAGTLEIGNIIDPPGSLWGNEEEYMFCRQCGKELEDRNRCPGRLPA